MPFFDPDTNMLFLAGKVGTTKSNCDIVCIKLHDMGTPSWIGKYMCSFIRDWGEVDSCNSYRVYWKENNPIEMWYLIRQRSQWCTIPAMSWFQFRFQAYSESLIPIPIPGLLWKLDSDSDSDSDSRFTLKTWFRFQFRFQQKVHDSTLIPIPGQILWFWFQL